MILVVVKPLLRQRHVEVFDSVSVLAKPFVGVERRCATIQGYIVSESFNEPGTGSTSIELERRHPVRN